MRVFRVEVLPTRLASLIDAGLQAQASESGEEGETAAPPAAPNYDGHGRFFGWGALGILGIFAIIFKIGFFFLLAMLFIWYV